MSKLEHNLMEVLLRLSAKSGTFQEVLQSLSDIDALEAVLKETKVFKELVNLNLLSEDDLICLMKHLQALFKSSNELRIFLKNEKFIEFLIEKIGFSDFWFWLNFSDGCLESFLKSDYLVKATLRKKLASNDDLKLFVSLMKTRGTIRALVEAEFLMKYLYAECLISEEQIKEFNQLLTTFEEWIGHIHHENFFEFAEFFTKHRYSGGWVEKDERNLDRTLLLMNEAYKCIYRLEHLTLDNRKVLFQLCVGSEKARSILSKIVSNNIQDQYDFEALRKLLTKDENKTLKTKFNF